MSKTSTIEIAVEVRVVRALAIQVFDGKRTVWLPISQIEDWTGGPDAAPGVGTTTVFIPEWLALEKGLI